MLAPVFRVLAAVGLLRWFRMRQRRIHTFVSNLRGATSTLTLARRPLTRIVPLSVDGGNVMVRHFGQEVSVSVGAPVTVPNHQAVGVGPVPCQPRHRGPPPHRAGVT